MRRHSNNRRSRLLLESLERRTLLSGTPSDHEHFTGPSLEVRPAAERPALGSQPPGSVGVRSDTKRPTAIGLSTRPGTYASGQVLQVAVKLSEAVTVTGTPSVRLGIGRSAIDAVFVGQSGQSTLLFEHVVSATTPAASGRLSLRAVNLGDIGNVADLAGNAMLARPLKTQAARISIDPVPPTVRSVSTSTPGLHGVGDAIAFQVRFSEKVSFDGQPLLRITVGNQQRDVPAVGGHRSDTLTFRYTVQAGDTAAEGVAVTEIVIPEGAALGDLAGNAANLDVPATVVRQARIDGRAPSITKIEEPSASVQPGSFVIVDVTYDEPVLVQGKPRIEVTIGGNRRSMTYAGPANRATETLRFRYLVSPQDGGDEVPLIGGRILVDRRSSIRDGAGNNAQTSLAPPPTISLLFDTGTSSSDGITRDGRVAVGGIESGARWEYSTDGGTQWRSGTGTGFTLGEGVYTAGSVRARQIDTAGNVSDPATLAGPVTVDVTAPVSPVATGYRTSTDSGIVVEAERDARIVAFGGGSSADITSHFRLSGVSQASATKDSSRLSSHRVGRFAATVAAVDRAGNQSAVSDTVEFTTPVRGVLVDGYIGGATVYQDANDNHLLDAGELQSVATAFGEFSLDIVDADAGQIRVVGGLDIGSNEPVTITLGTPTVQTSVNVITPLSTIAAMAERADATIPAGELESRIASLLGISLSAAPGGTLFGYDPIAVLRSADAVESASARQVYAANQMVVALGHTLGAVLHRTAADVRGGVAAAASQLAATAGVVVPGGFGFEVPVDWDVVAQDAMVQAMADIVATTANPSVLEGDSRASLLATAVTAADARMVAVFLDALASSSLTTSEGTRNYAEFLRDSLGATNPRAFVESALSDVGGRSRVLLAAAVENRVNAWQQAMGSSGSAEELARAITVISVAAKYLEMQSLGDLVDAAGNPATGQTAQSVVAAIAANAAAMSATAQEAIGDVLGVDTRTRYADAVVRILSDGADDYSGTNASEIIAARRGANLVRGNGGNDRLLGGEGVDTLSGGEGDDEIFGFRGDDVLNGDEGDDFISAGAGNDLVNGGTGNDTILGETGNDTISGGGGSDFILGGGGDDTITVGGNGGQPFNTYVDGGAGTNRLTIAYDGVTSLADFVVRRMGADGVLHLVDANGGEFRIRNFGLTPPTQPQPSTLTIGSTNYQIAGPNAYGGMGSSSASFGAALSVTTGEAVLYEIEGIGGPVAPVDPQGSTFHARRPWFEPPPLNGGTTPISDFSSQAWVIHGSDRRDIISSGTQADTIFSGDGDDHIYGRGGADTIVAGDGNDVVFFDTPETLATATAVDGGDGKDTLAFGRVVGFDWSYYVNSSLTIDMAAIGPAINFENAIGGLANDTILGDVGSNGLIGSSGADTLHGRDGDDTLYGDYDVLFPAWGVGGGFFGYRLEIINQGMYDQAGAGDDTLLGGAGRDQLYGERGNDLLDGGTGADILTGGAGFDTFVLRAGDGGVTAADADVITDFQDGVDVFGLADGLNFQSLVITQGNGSDTATTNTVIRTTSGEILVVVNNTPASSITVLDFQQQS